VFHWWRHWSVASPAWVRRPGSSSKADTLNIWCTNCRMWQLLYTVTETIKMLFPVVTFWKCVVTEVVLFSIVAFKTLHISQGSIATHVRCGGISSDSIIANFLLILTVKEFWQSVNIWLSEGVQNNDATFWATLYIKRVLADGCSRTVANLYSFPFVGHSQLSQCI